MGSAWDNGASAFDAACDDDGGGVIFALIQGICMHSDCNVCMTCK